MQRPPLIQYAVYSDPGYRAYRGNPFIEALPSPLDNRTVARLLKEDIDYRPEDCREPAHIRLHALQDILFWRWPTALHFDLQQRFSVMIRTGYRGRNPLHKAFWDDVRAGRQFLKQQSIPLQRETESTSTGFAIIGDSGTGKTCAVKNVLALYPQLIIHTRYDDQEFNRLQIVYVIVQCPPKGGLVALCHNFFRQVDKILGSTDYFNVYTRKGQARLAEMVGNMYTIAQVHGIGVIVIDEIQNLTEAKENDAEAMLNFFVQLVNDLCLPIVPVGTPKAIGVLSSAFRQARRVSGQGDCFVKRMKPGEDWDLFIKKMWCYQYLQHPVKLTPELSEALYYESQGIIDLVIKVFILAQIRAITTGNEIMREVLTEQTIHSVSDSLMLLQPMLSAIRSGNEEALKLYKDLYEAITINTQIQQALLKLPVSLLASVPLENSSIPDNVNRPNTLLPTPNKESSKKPKKSPTKQKQLVYQGGVLDVVLQGRADGITPYDALLKANYVQNLDTYQEVN
ncbi:MAG: TniB family NTP-binding protein [Coleofasciculus sp. S288]|nr:TniB family NTP-binding protein [Coleofasciculus sp. S288]